MAPPSRPHLTATFAYFPLRIHCGGYEDGVPGVMLVVYMVWLSAIAAQPPPEVLHVAVLYPKLSARQIIMIPGRAPSALFHPAARMKCVGAIGASLGALFALLNGSASAFSTSPAFASRREGCVGCQEAARWGMWGLPTKAKGPAPVSPAALDLQDSLRKLCADKSEPDREARIQQLAAVRHQHA